MQHFTYSNGVIAQTLSHARLTLASLALALPLASTSAHAEPAQASSIPSAAVHSVAVPENLRQQRQLYSQAIAAIRAGQFDEAADILPKIKHYALYPYLQYELYIHDLGAVDTTAYRQFMARYGDTPLAGSLQYRWLRQQARDQQWQRYLANYDDSIRSTRLQCHRLQALYETGAQQQAFDKVPELWRVGYSQPKACDPVFNAWIKEGKLTDELAWQRFWLAIDRGELGLASYISKLIKDPGFKDSANTVLQLGRQPRELAKLRISPDAPGYTPLVTYSLKRLLRYDKEQAFSLWQQYDPSLVLDTAEKKALERRLGLYFLKDFHSESTNRLDKIDPLHEDSLLLEWRIRYHLSQLQWQRVAVLLDKLPEHKQTEDRWQYWRARVLEQQAHLSQAIDIYKGLAKNRSFYGFLSAHRLGNDFNMNHRGATIDSRQQATLAQMPGLIMARELFYHEQRTRARRQWLHTTADFDHDQHHQVAVLAHRWGWHTQAIQSAIAARQWDDLQLRFPALYSDKIAANAKTFGLDNQLIFAITRQESAFKADVRSPAGAVGLMQLMPATARQTAKSINLPYRGSHELRTPAINLELGSAYLSQMLKRYDGNRIFAAAAYNAGPYRVKSWLESRGDLPIDMWIETIPFDETRQYVQNVLSYAVIYSDILGQKKQFLTVKEAATLPPLHQLATQ